MIALSTCFLLGFILVGISILAFNSLLWGFIIGELLALIIITLDAILEIKSEDLK